MAFFLLALDEAPAGTYNNEIRKSHEPCKREVMSLKTEKIWLDGELVRWEEAKVHVLAHALHYGTAYFEGIRCYALADGRSAVFRLEEHMRRFADSGKILGFPLPYTVEQLQQATLEVIRANQAQRMLHPALGFRGFGRDGALCAEESRQCLHRGLALGSLSRR